MATLTVNGRKVKVDDSFLSLSPQQQEATVNEIAASMGQGPQEPPPDVAAPQDGQAIPGGMSTLGEVSSNLEWAPGQQPKPTAADEALSFGRGMVDLPVIGPTLADWRRGLDANIASATGHGDADTLKKIYARNDELLKAKTGGARIAGQIAGSTLALSGLGTSAAGGRLLGTTGSLGSQLGFGAGSGAILSGADTAARGGDMGEIAKNAALGAGLGLVFPAAGALFSKGAQRGAQTAATNAAIKNAPAAVELKSAASGMFQQLDQNGVQVTGQRFGGMVSDLVQKFVKLKANATLDPKAVAALKEVVQTAKDVQQAGGGITLSDLHTLRQIAQKSAQSAEGRDKMFSTQIISAIDDMIGGLKPADMIGGADPKQASNLMFDAISTWGRSRRVGLLEEAMYRAQNTASGLENGLRVEFRKLLQNPDTRKLFTAAERQAIEDVGHGNIVSNTMKLLGKFGFGTNGAGNMLGGTIGFGAGNILGGPVGGILATAAGTAARKGSEKLTEKAAERAAKVVATPNVPVMPPWSMPRGLLAPATLPVEVTRKRKPIEIVVRGGAYS